MVKSVTSLGRSGVADFVIQRLSAVILLAYILYLGFVVVSTPDLGYADWKLTFEPTWMKVFSLLAILSLAGHAWIGWWAVLSDYVTERMMGAKATFLRLLAQFVGFVILVFYMVWAFQILWG
ncbi:MAG: succinate dehydrogenase, hydrophobic membrane anchor protein [Gammaproteobacteria bacterium]|jgi:succinate dehydrogenase / fumarate reductase membrane anchor subunit|nr:succinate dehydrogenase, hydrophobic membrane anchor protein [Gammaproteobacteria bacterium]